MKRLGRVTVYAAFFLAAAVTGLAQDAGTSSAPPSNQQARQQQQSGAERREAERGRGAEDRDEARRQPGVRCTRYRRKK